MPVRSHKTAEDRLNANMRAIGGQIAKLASRKAKTEDILVGARKTSYAVKTDARGHKSVTVRSPKEAASGTLEIERKRLAALRRQIAAKVAKMPNRTADDRCRRLVVRNFGFEDAAMVAFAHKVWRAARKVTISKGCPKCGFAGRVRNPRR